MAKMIFPQQITNKVDRHNYALRTAELLRLEYNKNGKDFREGKITQKQWDDFKKINNEQETATAVEIVRYRNRIKNDATILNDLTGVFE